MTQTRQTGTTRPPAGAGSAVAVPLLAGLVTAIAVFGLLLFAEMENREERLESDNAGSVTLVRANFDALWERASAVGGHASRHMNGADAAAVAGVIGQYKSYWPEAAFSVYDRDGNLLLLPGRDEDPAPVPGLARELVHKALVGQNARDLTVVRGFVSLSASVPLRGREAKALVVSVPLDSFALEGLKPLCKADLALLPVDEASGAALGDTGMAANTFARSKDAAARAWPALGRDMQGVKLDAIRRIPLSVGLSAVAVPLASESGAPLGVLLAAPLRAAPLDWGAPWRMAAAIGCGLPAALLASWLYRRRGRRLAEALAGAVAAMADDAPEAAAIWRHAAWPRPLASALEKMAATLRECRIRTWNAERDRDAGRRQAAESGGQDSARERNFERLFGSMPTGAFQAERDGRFIRVNQAFAHLLGYDSPTSLLVENASFSEFFLYGDEFRSPLAALAGQRGERHLVSLRRRDGKVRHFALLFSPSTDADNDPAAILEGFLLDRSMDEKLTRAVLDRDFAKRQRASLALLLAATCRQTQGYLEAEIRPEPDAGGQERVQVLSQERREGMTSVRGILGDLYQIAMSEVEGSPPSTVPLDMGRFLSRTCRQVLPGLKARGVSLRCEVTEELLTRLSGPAPLLRHALQRALITVTATARGGWAWLSVMRDPNAPRSPGVTRILFSASWNAYFSESGSFSGGLDFPLGGHAVVAFDAPADPEGVHEERNTGGLDLASEQEVIRYLAQRMHGELLEGVFTNDTRSIQIIVPLDELATAAGAFAAPLHSERADQAEQTELPLDGPVADGGLGLEVSRPSVAMEDDGIQGEGLAPDGTSQPLKLLVLDEGSDPLEAGVKPRDGLDILLVDASLNNRLLFSLFLRDSSHRITETHDGQEGVEAFQRGRFDVIFMDMEMPLMDGYQATRIIRALEADRGLPSTPIVGMTTYALPEFRRQCLLSGCSDFLAKPFTKTALFSLLDALMQIKQDADHPPHSFSPS